MTGVQRRVIQAGVLAVVALACFAELLYIFPIPGGIIWQLELPGGPDVVLGSGYIRSFSLRQWPDVLIEAQPGAKESSAFAMALGQILSPLSGIQGAWLLIALPIVGAFGVVMLIHLLLAFPGGRLVSGVDRALVRSFYIVLPLAALVGAAATNLSPEALGLLGPFSSNIYVSANTVPNLIYLACL